MRAKWTSLCGATGCCTVGVTLTPPFTPRTGKVSLHSTARCCGGLYCLLMVVPHIGREFNRKRRKCQNVKRRHQIVWIDEHNELLLLACNLKKWKMFSFFLSFYNYKRCYLENSSFWGASGASCRRYLTQHLIMLALFRFKERLGIFKNVSPTFIQIRQ